MRYMIWMTVIFMLLVILENVRELHTFRITHANIQTDKLSRESVELRVAVLSDLHNYTYGKHNRKLLDSIRRERPDLILVAGDMLIGKKGVPFTVAGEFMQEVSKIAPVYYGNGNHEQRMKEERVHYGNEYQKYRNLLRNSRIRFLENESEFFRWKGERIRVTGLEIPLSYYKKFQGQTLKSEEIEKRIGDADEKHLQILIAHNPVHGATYAKWGADIVVSGHLHGGIVRLPFLGGMVTPQLRLFPKYSGGVYQEGKTTLVVSKGLGTHTFPIRFLNEAEVVMLHIKGRGE